MFNWFWDFLYSISKSLFELIDGIMQCANILCGIDPIEFNGEETDLITYLFRNDQISFAFKVSAVIGLIVLVILTIIAIIRLIVKEKPDETPGTICLKAFKSILLFMFVPFIMIVLINLCNIFMIALYKATLSGTTSIGSFLFTAFANGQENPGYNLADFITLDSSGIALADYRNIDIVRTYINLNNFSFFTSWIAGIVILINIAWALLVFVERAISLAILFIVSPFSIASSVIDGGTRFKLWRDQVMIKFIVGYGTILGINIYCLVVSAVMNPNLVFFSNDFLNYLIKILFIIGGALSMRKSMGLVGNLVSQGAGSQELREAAMSRGGVMRALGGGFTGLGQSAIGATRAMLHPAQTASNAINGLKASLGFSSPQADPKLEAQNKTNDLLQRLVGDSNNRFNGGNEINNNQNSMRDLISNSGSESNNSESNRNSDNTNNRMENAVKNSLLNSGMSNENGGDKK